MKSNMKHKLFLFISCTLLFLGCHKVSETTLIGKINGDEIYLLGNNFVVLKLSIYDKDLDKIGVCFSDKIGVQLSVDTAGHALFYESYDDSYFVKIDNLKERTTYYWRSFIQKENILVYGKINSFTTTGPNTGSWTQMADFPGEARGAAVGFSIGNKGYVGLGESGSGDSYGPYYKDFWEYDPSTNTWTQIADFPGGERWSAVGFSIGDRGYVGTGSFGPDYRSLTYLQDFWEYNPATNAWTKKADVPGRTRECAVGFSIGNKGYVGTGRNRTVSPKDFWQYDPVLDSWERKEDMPVYSRYCAVGFSIGNKGYVGTGFDGRIGYGTDVWEYDPSSDSWTEKAYFTGNRKWCAFGFSIGDKGYLGGGGLASGLMFNDFWEYTPISDSWKLKDIYPGGGGYCSVGFSIGDKGYVGIGWGDGGTHKDFWRFTP